MNKFCFVLLFSFLFLFPKLTYAQECSSTKGCYRDNAEIAGPDCSCPSIAGGDNSNCELANCPEIIDCVWSDWSACSKKCGGGVQTRTIKTPAEGGGKACIGSTTQSCNTEPCPYYRISDCDTNTGRYACINDGEHGTKTPYTSMKGCERDAKCVKDISKEVEEVFGTCWSRKTYAFTSNTGDGAVGKWAVGDLNNDGYDDIVSLRYFVDRYRYYFVHTLMNERKVDGSFNRLNIGETRYFTSNNGYSSFINIDEYGSDGKNRLVIGMEMTNKVTWSVLWNDLKSDDCGPDVCENTPWKSIDVMSLGYNNKYQGAKSIDINGDGYTDLILPLGQSPSKWLLVEGSGNSDLFSGVSDFSKNSNFYGTYEKNVIDFGDFLGNDKKGVAWIYNSSTAGKIAVYPNKNNLLSSSIDIITKNPDIRTLAVGDFNGDGRDDIVVGGIYGDKPFIEIYESKINDGVLSFENIIVFNINDTGLINSMISLDFDGDGLMDVVSINKDGRFYIIKGDKDSNYGISGSFVTSNETNTEITLANFDHKGGDDFVVFTKDSALVYLNSCEPSNNTKKCNVCQLGDKTKGDANCDGKITMVDFEIWRNEYFDIKDDNYDWKANFSCTDELKKPSMVDFNIWRKSYFGV
jgi:hypothetical protein